MIMPNTPLSITFAPQDGGAPINVAALSRFIGLRLGPSAGLHRVITINKDFHIVGEYKPRD